MTTFHGGIPFTSNCHGFCHVASNFLLGVLPGADVAKNLLEAIRAKKDVDQLQTILNNIPANATGHEDFNTDGMGDSFCSLHLLIAGVWQRGLNQKSTLL